MKPCVIHVGRTDKDGYGLVPSGRHAVSIRAHRYAWEQVHGPVPEGMLVLHHCDNPPCIEVEHLFLGTNADNVADKVAKGRQRGPARGEGHFNARLTDAQAAEIRAMREQGVYQHILAERFGVSRRTIRKILSGESYPPPNTPREGTP